MKSLWMLSTVILSNLFPMQKRDLQLNEGFSVRTIAYKKATFPIASLTGLINLPDMDQMVPTAFQCSSARIIMPELSSQDKPSFINQFLSATQYLVAGSDTTINPADSVKVLISNGREAIEFSPLSSINNGALIQPLNRSTNKGISTAFYLTDTARWAFYTNSQQRLSINGDGKIISNSSLLINNKNGDKDALRVNGTARFDSTVFMVGRADSSSFISFNNNILRAITEPDDGISPYTSTPTGWAIGKSLPVFRLRHPNNVAGYQPGVNSSLQRDFMIYPYEYGTAIEYNGLVECWVGGWSIHRGLSFVDIEGKGNGWGGVLWVGDDHDLGGVRATARDNTMLGGNVNYGEISVEKFSGAEHGDFRLRLPETKNDFQFVYGEKGSTNIVAKMSVRGLVIPKVSSVTSVPNPEKAQLSYDSTDNRFKGFNGTAWVELGTTTGAAVQSGNGTLKVFTILHGQSSTPSYFNATATSPDAANIGYVTADATSISLHYTIAPPAGSNNLSWNWQIKK